MMKCRHILADLQSASIEYKHLQCETKESRDYKSLYSFTAGFLRSALADAQAATPEVKSARTSAIKQV